MLQLPSFLPISLLALSLSGCGLFPKTVKVGSKNSATQMVIAEIAAQHLESKGFKVVRRIGMGNTAIVHQATLGGDIDIYPEDTGTALAAMLKENPIPDLDAQYERVRNEYERLYGLRVIKPIGASNRPVALVSETLAAKEKLNTLSEAAASPVLWRIGSPEEFSIRPDGMQGLSSRYRLQQKEALRLMEAPNLYQALQDGQLDMIVVNESDGILGSKGVRALQDDKGLFTPGQLCLLARKDTLSAVPSLEGALSALSGKVPTEALRALNKQVELDKRSVADVAAEFLKSAGLR
jgi:osmoprotectant transport system substrate-binding protein